jgi:hypothetical protein
MVPRALAQPIDEDEALRIEARLAAIAQIRRIENARHEHLAAVKREARRRQIKNRVGTAIGLVSATALTAHAASASYFSGSATAVQSGATTAGNVKLATAHPFSSQHFDASATDFYPGQTRYRAVDLTISGNLNMKSVTVEFTSGANCSGCQTSLLDNDATNGLQLKVEVCPTGNTFAISGSSPDASATCNGQAPGNAPWTTAYASAALATVMRNGTHDGSIDISSSVTMTAGATTHLLFEYTLPTASASSTQGQTSIIDIKFMGVGRDGTTR